MMEQGASIVRCCLNMASGFIIAQPGNDCKSHYPSRRLFKDWVS